jgi:hypothetical protein
MAVATQPAKPLDATNDLANQVQNVGLVKPPVLKAPTASPTMEPAGVAPVNASLPAPTGGPAPATVQPSPVQAPAPSVPPTPISSFTADSNLTGAQINPTAPTATAPTFDNQRVDTLGTQQDAAVTNLTGGPNRTQLAMQALRDFDTAGQPQLEEGYRRVGQRAAALGRLGAGMTTNDLTGLNATYQRDRGLAAR